MLNQLFLLLPNTTATGCFRSPIEEDGLATRDYMALSLLDHPICLANVKESIMVPIVRDKNVSDPDNYRGIAVASVMLKLFERLC